MAGIYIQRHPEHTAFYRVFFYYFERFLCEYEDRFEREYGFLRNADSILRVMPKEERNGENGCARNFCLISPTALSSPARNFDCSRGEGGNIFKASVDRKPWSFSGTVYPFTYTFCSSLTTQKHIFPCMFHILMKLLPINIIHQSFNLLPCRPSCEYIPHDT